MAVNQQQVDNLVNMLDGYVEQGGHHLTYLQEKHY